MRRTKFELYYSILRTLQVDGCLPFTHIMYKSDINSEVLSRIIKVLEKKHFIEKRKGKVYAITEKGRRVMAFFGEIESSFGA